MMDSLSAPEAMLGAFGTSTPIAAATAPMIDAQGRITLPGFPSGLSIEAYLPLVHQYGRILEASRILDRFRMDLRRFETLDINPMQAPLTPLTPSRLNPHMFYKREDQTITHAYKVRGAVVGMAKKMESEGFRRFIAVSTGNHALGVFKAAELLKPDGVTVVVPTNTSPLKLEKLQGVLADLQSRHFKADLIQVGQTFDEARAWAMTRESAKEAYIDPYGDPWVVAGQGTLGLELLHQIGQILTEAERDGSPYEEVVVIAPIGGGGLLTGTATALKMASSWEPAFRNVSLKFLGLRLASMDAELGDAIRVANIAESNKLVMEALGVGILHVTDAHMRSGMDHVHDDIGQIVEGASGAAVQPALQQAGYQPTAKRLVVSILSGANTPQTRPT